MKRRGFLRLLGLGGAAVTTASLIKESIAKSQDLSKVLVEVPNTQDHKWPTEEPGLCCTAVTGARYASYTSVSPIARGESKYK